MTDHFPSEDLNGQAGLVDPPAPRARRVAPGRGKWMTKDGTVIAIRDMEDNHVINCIRFLRRHGRAHLFNIGLSAGHFAATTGGDMAADAAEDAANEAFDTAWDGSRLHEFCLDEYPKYRELWAEVERRQLVVGAL